MNINCLYEIMLSMKASFQECIVEALCVSEINFPSKLPNSEEDAVCEDAVREWNFLWDLRAITEDHCEKYELTENGGGRTPKVIQRF